jgi:EamA domain-containing membrane protein RarD
VRRDERPLGRAGGLPTIALVRYVWLAIIAVCLLPVALIGFFANPLVFIVLGSEEWRERLTRLYPYRWWFGLSLIVCAVATAVYGVRYG